VKCANFCILTALRRLQSDNRSTLDKERWQLQQISQNLSMFCSPHT